MGLPRRQSAGAKVKPLVVATVGLRPDGEADLDRRVLDFGKALKIRLDGGLLFDGRIGAIEAEFAEAAPPVATAAPVPDSLPVVTSDTFGQVRIGLEGDSSDLRVSLAVSGGAPALLAAEAPRLAADLAANGIRLHSLDVGSFAGGAGGGGQQRPAAQPGSAAPASPPAAAFTAPPPSRPAAADRYA